MDLRWQDDDSEARFSAYVETLSVCLGHADRVAPFRSYCTGLLLPGARKSVEPMAARLRPDLGGTSISAAFCRTICLGRDGPARLGPPFGAAGDDRGAGDRGLDRGRYGLSQEGPSFGRRRPPVLRPARQAGELPGGGFALHSDLTGEPASGLAALSAPGLVREWGRGRGAPEKGQGSGVGRVSQARDRTGADRGGAGRGVGAGVVLADAG